ncbi:MAG TPA: hypothetical protein VF767_06910, partial [Bryobacteraceae bacterium]
MKTRLFCTLALAFMVSCGSRDTAKPVAEGRGVRLEFDQNLHSRVVARFGKSEVALGSFSPSEYVTSAGAEIRDFPLQAQASAEVRDSFGKGLRKTFTGSAASLKKEVAATVYEDYPTAVVLQVRYT